MGNRVEPLDYWVRRSRVLVTWLTADFTSDLDQRPIRVPPVVFHSGHIRMSLAAELIVVLETIAVCSQETMRNPTDTGGR